MSQKFDFLKSTLIFSIVGVFIPILTTMGLVFFQMLLSKFHIECSIAWYMIFYSSIGGAFVLPILFYRHLITVPIEHSQELRPKLILFNIVEYIFIQISIGSIYTNGDLLCYANGGQNGIEFIFTGWLAIPILLTFSIVFNFFYYRKNS